MEKSNNDLMNYSLGIHTLWDANCNSANCGDSGELKSFIGTDGERHQRWSSQCVGYALRNGLKKKFSNSCGFSVDKDDICEKIDDYCVNNNFTDKDKINLIKEFVCKQLEAQENHVREINYTEIENIMSGIKSQDFDVFEVKKDKLVICEKKMINIVETAHEMSENSIDIALRGRMFANSNMSDWNITGALSIAQYMGINVLKTENDFWGHFSDNKKSFGDAGDTEYASSIMYGFQSLDFRQLFKNLNYNIDNIKNVLSYDLIQILINAHALGKRHSFGIPDYPIYYELVLTKRNSTQIPFSIICGKKIEDVGKLIHDYIVNTRKENIVCTNKDNLEEWINTFLTVK